MRLVALPTVCAAPRRHGFQSVANAGCVPNRLPCHEALAEQPDHLRAFRELAMIERIAALEPSGREPSPPPSPVRLDRAAGTWVDLAQPVDIAADKARHAKGLIVLGDEKRKLRTDRAQFLRLPAKDINVEIRRCQNDVPDLRLNTTIADRL